MDWWLLSCVCMILFFSVRGQPQSNRTAPHSPYPSLFRSLSSAALQRKGPAMSLVASAADAAYARVRPLVHASDGEAAHNLTLAALQPLPRARRALTSPALATELAGIAFPNPVGLAPGFDKNARVAHAMPHFGFGFVEVGTLGSEENTSELQSLMRNSYAVFCLN